MSGLPSSLASLPVLQGLFHSAVSVPCWDRTNGADLMLSDLWQLFLYSEKSNYPTWIFCNPHYYYVFTFSKPSIDIILIFPYVVSYVLCLEAHPGPSPVDGTLWNVCNYFCVTSVTSGCSTEVLGSVRAWLGLACTSGDAERHPCPCASDLTSVNQNFGLL